MNLRSKSNDEDGDGKGDAFAKMNEILVKLKEERKKKNEIAAATEEFKGEAKNEDVKEKEVEVKEEVKQEVQVQRVDEVIAKIEEEVSMQVEPTKDHSPSPSPTKPSTPKAPFSNYAKRKSTFKDSKKADAVDANAKRWSTAVKIEVGDVEMSSPFVFPDEEYNPSGDNETKIEAENIVRKLSSTLSPSIERAVESRFSDHQKKLSGAGAGARAFVGGKIKRGSKR